VLPYARRYLGDPTKRPLSTKKGALLCAAPLALSLAALGAWSLSSEDAAPRTPGSSKESLQSRAESAFQGGDYDACEKLLMVQLGEDPKNTQALFLLAQVFHKTGRSGDFSRILLALAKSNRLCNDELRTAIRCLTDLTGHDANDFSALKALAICGQKSGDSLLALDSAHRALCLVPQDTDLIALMTECAERSAIPSDRGLNRHTRPTRELMNSRR